MAKLDEFTMKGMPPDVIDFKDEVTTILNNGKYQSIVVTTPPTWTARNGEFVFFNSSGTTRTYFFNNNTWNFLQYPGGADALVNAISDNLTTASATLLNVSNNLIAVSNNVVTGSTTLLNVSNNLVGVSNNLVTGSTTILNVSNNLVVISNGLASLSNNSLKAEVTFNGSVLAILQSRNVTSVTRNSPGNYTVTWVTSFANTAGMVVGNARPYTGFNLKGMMLVPSTPTISSILFNTVASNDTPTDTDLCYVLAAGTN